MANEYYQSAYTGEQIDNTIGRIVNGEFDGVAENAQRAALSAESAKASELAADKARQEAEEARDSAREIAGGNFATPTEVNAAANAAEQRANEHSDAALDDHKLDTNNPHRVTAAQTGAEPAFDVLPVEKGGTGVSVLTEIRENIGIAYGATVDANSSGAITLPTNGVFLVCIAGNANNGAILVFTGTASRGVDKVEELTALKAWSYSYASGNLALTINNTANYSASFAVTSLRYSVYEGG